MPRRAAAVSLLVAAITVARAGAQDLPAETPPAVTALERVTFDEAVRRALDHNPGVAEAAQAILRARGFLTQAGAVFYPTVTGAAGTTVLDAARGFAGNVTQPRTQAFFNATVSYPVLAAERWAERAQAADQVQVATFSAEETRQQVAVNAASAYLAVVASQRQLDISTANRATAAALAEYARVRLEAGQGSRLNHVRAVQELATTEGRVLAAALAVRRAQEALGVAIFAEGPVDVNGDPQLRPAAPPPDDRWLLDRPDVRRSSAQLSAAERVARDTWKSWLPTVSAAFTPQYVTPKGFFEPASTWRASFVLQVPLFDGTLAGNRRVRQAERETARLRLQDVEEQARSELRLAREAVARNEQIVAASRQAAEAAAEVLRITEVAYRAGATSNIEVVQAQETARNAESEMALAEDRLRQARLDLLVALGQFPG
jgi:outer membrane protein TolC